MNRMVASYFVIGHPFILTRVSIFKKAGTYFLFEGSEWTIWFRIGRRNPRTRQTDLNIVVNARLFGMICTVLFLVLLFLRRDVDHT